jgi:hypothetical protein
MGAQLTTTQQTSQLQVTSLGNGNFYDPRHGLLLRSGANPQEIICVGTFDPATRQQYPLTAEKIQVCQQLGVNYLDPSKASNSAGQPQTVSALPSFSTMTQGLPTTSAAPIGAVSSLQSVSTPPSQSAAVLPSFGQQVGTLPQVSNIPSLPMQQSMGLGGLPSVQGLPAQQPLQQGFPSVSQLPSSTLPNMMPQGLPSAGQQQTVGLPQFQQQPQQQFQQQFQQQPQQQFQQQQFQQLPQQFQQVGLPQQGVNNLPTMGTPNLGKMTGLPVMGVSGAIPSVADIAASSASDPIEADDDDDEDNEDDVSN